MADEIHKPPPTWKPPWEKQDEKYLPGTWEGAHLLPGNKPYPQIIGKVLSHDEVAEYRLVNTRGYRDLIATLDKANGERY